jgi:hypothetical protein
MSSYNSGNTISVTLTSANLQKAFLPFWVFKKLTSCVKNSNLCVEMTFSEGSGIPKLKKKNIGVKLESEMPDVVIKYISLKVLSHI